MKKALMIAAAVIAGIAVLIYAGVIVPRPTGLPGNPAYKTTAPR